MENEEVDLTAYCGLYCGDCIRYRSQAADLARDLLSELRRTKFHRYAEFKLGLDNWVEHRRKPYVWQQPANS